MRWLMCSLVLDPVQLTPRMNTTTTPNRASRARAMDGIHGPLQRLLGDVSEHVLKLQEERDEWKIKYLKARETIDKYKKLLEKLSRSDEMKEDNKKLIINETKHDEFDELDLEDKREPQRILYNMNKAKNSGEHLEYSVIYLSDSEEARTEPREHEAREHEAREGHEAHEAREAHEAHEAREGHEAHEAREAHEAHEDERSDDEFELFRHTPLKRRVSMRDEDTTAKYGAHEPDHVTDEPRAKKQFKYVAPIRKKHDREQLTGHECEQCAQFYAAIYGEGAAPTHTHEHEHEHEHHGHKSKEQLIGHVSRHKQLYTPPQTPEGYWDLSFPHGSGEGEGEGEGE